MGRGRAKAKQTKVARELKYRSFGTDFGSLEAELRHDGHEVPPAYAELADKYEVSDDDEEDQPRSYAVEDDGDEDYAELRKSG